MDELNKPIETDIQKNQHPDYQKWVNDPKFTQLIADKRRFIAPTVIGFLICYFLLPILAIYTNLLTKTTIWGITYIWAFALFQLVVIWVLGFLFMHKSEKFDQTAKEILSDLSMEDK